MIGNYFSFYFIVKKSYITQIKTRKSMNHSIKHEANDSFRSIILTEKEIFQSTKLFTRNDNANQTKLSDYLDD